MELMIYLHHHILGLLATLVMPNLVGKESKQNKNWCAGTDENHRRIIEAVEQGGYPSMEHGLIGNSSRYLKYTLTKGALASNLFV